MTILEYRTAYEKYKVSKNDAELYSISDEIDKMSHEERILFREEIAKAGLPMMPNLTYDYIKQCWILRPDGKLFSFSK